MIRAEFVFMLGGEINDEEVEAEQSVELQAGRLQNRGQRDLRAATIAMSQAEKLLTGANTADALVAERAAVTALQRAFSRDRYILRALATRSQLDPARRLTGSSADATGWRRCRAGCGGEPARRRCCRICCAGSLTVRLKPDTANYVKWLVVSGFSRTHALVAGRRGDSNRSVLRAAAVRPRPSSSARLIPLDPAARSKALAAASAAAAGAERAAPMRRSRRLVVAPALGGAFVDAIARPRIPQ